MTPHKNRRRLAARALAVSLILPFTILPVGAGPNAGQGVSAVYSVRLIGLSLGTAQVRGQFGPGAYRIEAYARLTGIAKAISNARGAATASGRIIGGRVAPNAYATTSSNSKRKRTVRMGMVAGNVRAVAIDPPIEPKPGRVPLRANHKRRIIDPLSALVMPVSGGDMIGPAACNRTIPVFDGYTRFNISLNYAGTRNVAVNGYRGPVVVCRARYRPVAGHRPHRKVTKFMVANRNMEVWLAPLQSARVMVPFRISVATMVGTTVIEARRFTITGSPATATVRR